ncbi:hypothetical protein KCU71_g97, partial [Aureobasidium melanogenum]
MNQGDESPLFCRDDTPPRSGVPPGYTSIRPLLLQQQQSSSSHQTQRSIAFEDEVLQDFGETDASREEDNGTSSALVNLNNGHESDTIDAAPIAAESDPVLNTFLSITLPATRTKPLLMTVSLDRVSLQMMNMNKLLKLPSLSGGASVMRVPFSAEKISRLVVVYVLVISP